MQYVSSLLTLQRQLLKHCWSELRCYLQLEEYKDAFRIFDRSGTGSFTAEDIGWVMRSLGQKSTQPQIDAIIRDMDLDNDGVIDLAEFMVRMMALTTKVRCLTASCMSTSKTSCVGMPLSALHRARLIMICTASSCAQAASMHSQKVPHLWATEQACLQTAAEEDLKHVFDVLDKSGEGMLNADGLRTAIKVHSMDA